LTALISQIKERVKLIIQFVLSHCVNSNVLSIAATRCKAPVVARLLGLVIPLTVTFVVEIAIITLPKLR
jgi:hypothetical protein